MKEKKYKSRNSQISSMGRYIKRNVDLNKICQICHTKDNVRISYSHDDIYKIHLLCNTCIKKYHADHKNSDEIIEKLEWIDIRDHLKEDKVFKPTHKHIKMLQDALLVDNNVLEELDKQGINSYKFYKILAYSKLNYPELAEEIFRHNSKVRADRIKKTKNEKLLGYSTNNITKLKLKYNISDKEISEKSSNKITPASISNIARGKVKPNIGTKIILAKVFNTSVTEVFPEEIWFTEIYNEQDYILYINDLIKRLKEKIQAFRGNKVKRVILAIAKDIKISSNRLYSILSHRNMPTTEEITKLETFISEN